MSVEASAYVWKNSNQKGTALLLLVAIADFTNAEGWAWPSISSLCQRIRMGERYVQKLIVKLEKDGEISVHPRQNASNYYRILGVNYSSEGVNRGSQRGEPGFARGVNQSAPKPLIEPSEEPLKKGAIASFDFPDCLNNDLFKKTWNEYLAYRRERKISKLKPTSILRMLNDFEKYGSDVSIAALEASMKNGWIGVFPQKVKSSGSQQSQPQNINYAAGF